MAGSKFRPPNPIVLGDVVREHLGQQLRGVYSDLIVSDLPSDLVRLIGRLENSIRIPHDPHDSGFVQDLLNSICHLRAFAISLTHDVNRAEDLVQSTLLKACDRRNRFEPGTCLQAWLFTILKNDFHTEHRKRQREVEDVEGAYAARLIALPEQLDELELQDLLQALSKLPAWQREVLLLVGVEGLSYEEIAARQHVTVGTVKSRVNRARHHLADILGLGPDDAIGSRFSHPEQAERRGAESLHHLG
ncbi:sigma-70 family RNA polymerase sigma factor [Microvirga calopogonii]|uniref:sigma-70 family RNA polymerase sigma factor n=1 Tax=Microvirga calopogonii TaxID=2078013 RepID=UPI000E0D4B5D|nr:sigma-70 family RNA polymerase sigma factor [Microvirga calopogonii]